MAEPFSSLPEPFPCPRCGAPDVMVNADVLVWLGTQQPAAGLPLYLTDDPGWHCGNPACQASGDVDSNGPLRKKANDGQNAD